MPYYYLAKLYATTYDIEKAKECLQKALGITKTHLASYLLLVLILSTDGSWKKAGMVLRELINDPVHSSQSVIYVLKAFLTIQVHLGQSDKLGGWDEAGEIGGDHKYREMLRQKLKRLLLQSIQPVLKKTFPDLTYNRIPKIADIVARP